MCVSTNAVIERPGGHRQPHRQMRRRRERKGENSKERSSVPQEPRMKAQARLAKLPSLAPQETHPGH